MSAPYQRVQLSLVCETTTAHLPQQIRSGQDVAQLAQTIIGREPRECFLAFYLDSRHGLIAAHVVSIGVATATLVHPREVFGPALQLAATSLIVTHNHPSGDASPSAEDRTVTERLREAGTLLGITLLDHMVIGAARYYSFADEGFFPFDVR